jgi:uncharacterized protein YbbC (DUF1343 family)
MSETPLHQDQACYGLDLREYDLKQLRKKGHINIRWMMDMYKDYPIKDKFFDRSQSKQMGDIDKLAGTKQFKDQIIAGKKEKEIRKSWEPGLSNYKTMRLKYVLYP